MRPITFTVAFTLTLLPVSCGGPAQLNAPLPTATPIVVTMGQSLDVEASARLKSLLFADQPLDVLMEQVAPPPAEEVDPWRSYALALAHLKQGKTQEAKRVLKRTLQAPEMETRQLLSTWSALRGLGERPPAAVADKVRGVVFELHNEAGVGTIASYSDGRARWLGGQGAAIFWEAYGTDKEIDALITTMLKAAEPLVKRSPAVEQHASTEPALSYVRISVLTFGGIHITEVFGPAIEEEQGRFALPVFMASVNLLNALSERGDKKRG